MMPNLKKVFFFSILFFQFLNAGEQPFVMGALQGQLGNQLFIIAATTSLALDHGAIPIFPDFLHAARNNIPFNYNQLFSHLDPYFPRKERIARYYVEPAFDYHPIPYRPNLCLVGYFQSEKYFRHRKQEILTLFAPPPHISNYLNEKYRKLLDHPCTVSIHVRFYADSGSEKETYTTIRRPYFEKAIQHFPEEACFVVFSNQMQRCKQELSSIKRTFYFIEEEDYIHDFYLMSLCKHHIICNSSFSWWAAYLNSNPDKKVIAPYPWFTPASGIDFKDLIPEEWTIILFE